MALAKKVVSVVENSKEQKIQEQMAWMMAMVEMYAQQAALVNRTLEETHVKLNARIVELQRKNQFLKETRRGMRNDP